MEGRPPSDDDLFEWDDSPPRPRRERERFETGEQRYAALELPGGRAFASVLTYVPNDDYNCKIVKARTIVALDVVEPQKMAQTIETPKAQAMAQSITSTGRVALYGIHFDSRPARSVIVGAM